MGSDDIRRQGSADRWCHGSVTSAGISIPSGAERSVMLEGREVPRPSAPGSAWGMLSVGTEAASSGCVR